MNLFIAVLKYELRNKELNGISPRIALANHRQGRRTECISQFTSHDCLVTPRSQVSCVLSPERPTGRGVRINHDRTALGQYTAVSMTEVVTAWRTTGVRPPALLFPRHHLTVHKSISFQRSISLTNVSRIDEYTVPPSLIRDKSWGITGIDTNPISLQWCYTTVVKVNGQLTIGK